MRESDEDLKEKEYRKFTIYLIIAFIISVICILIFSYAITMITARMAYEATISVKKSMLKENVQSLISYIDICADEYLEDNPDADNEELEDAMTEIARRKIYSEMHIDGTYMWVHNVLNYEGGDEYAIRLIHPNLSDTEGEYLSTNTRNPSGVYAYRDELEGVVKNGSVYLTYDFKKLESDEITRKETYSELYKRFDWIVCMGVNLDNLEHYQKEAMDKMSIPHILLLVFSSIIWLALLSIMIRAYKKTSGKVLENKNKELSDQLDWDTVSGANSRVCGQKLLNEAYRNFNSGEPDILVAMMDIDYFKQFNDSYGHGLGDKVLRAFVEAVRSSVSEKDSVIRWGGDEFIAIVHGISLDQQPELGDRIINAIRDIKIPDIEGDVTISASVGFSYFRDSDGDVNGILKRTDEAVYEAKESGRNNWKISE
ncbi:MAG: diguanylate cyclase [Lachnospiraceae bacterium]|nr:diguanylate cyclase [Lachnospiraceae bacterium]